VNISSPALSVAIVVSLTLLALGAAAATAILVVTGHGGDSGLIAVAVGPIIGSIVSFAGAARSSSAAQAVATTAQAHVDTTVQKLANGGLDTAVRQSLDNIQSAAVSGGQSNAPS
jgi:hypothetical protein